MRRRKSHGPPCSCTDFPACDPPNWVSASVCTGPCRYAPSTTRPLRRKAPGPYSGAATVRGVCGPRHCLPARMPGATHCSMPCGNGTARGWPRSHRGMPRRASPKMRPICAGATWCIRSNSQRARAARRATPCGCCGASGRTRLAGWSRVSSRNRWSSIAACPRAPPGPLSHCRHCPARPRSGTSPRLDQLAAPYAGNCHADPHSCGRGVGAAVSPALAKPPLSTRRHRRFLNQVGALRFWPSGGSPRAVFISRQRSRALPGVCAGPVVGRGGQAARQ